MFIPKYLSNELTLSDNLIECIFLHAEELKNCVSLVEKTGYTENGDTRRAQIVFAIR